MASSPSHPSRLIWLLLIGGFLPMIVVVGALLLAAWMLGSGLFLLLPALTIIGFSLALLSVGWLARLFHIPKAPGLKIVDAATAPELHGALEQVRAGFQGPRHRQVRVFRGYGMDLLSFPILGPLGWVSHQWRIGAFSMMYLTEREFLSVAGWNLAYWSDQHGWMNLQVKRLIEMWHRIGSITSPLPAAGARKRGWRLFRRGDNTLGPFARWFNAQAFPFLQDQILVADNSIVRAFGAQTHAQALLKLALDQPLLDRHLFKTWLEGEAEGRPWPDHPLLEARAFYGAWPPESFGFALQEALAGQFGHGPAWLGARLSRLEMELRLPMPPQRSAFERFLEDGAPALVEELDTAWRDELQALGERRVQGRGADGERFLRLMEGEAKGSLTGKERVDLARLAATREAPEAHGGRLDRLVAELPRSGDASHLRAKFLIESGRHEEGLEEVERLRNLHPFNGILGQELIARSYELRGDAEGERAARLAALDLKPLIKEAQAERAQFTLKDPMEAHGIPEEDLAPILDYLRTLPKVRRAFLVRKRLRLFPDRPVLMLGILPKERILPSLHEKWRAEFQSRLARECPWPTDTKGFVLVFGGWLRGRERPLKRVAGSEIYPRRRWFP